MAFSVTTTIPQTTAVTQNIAVPNSGGTYQIYVQDYHLFNRFQNTPSTITCSVMDSRLLTKDRYSVTIPTNATGSPRTISINGVGPSGDLVNVFTGIQA